MSRYFTRRCLELHFPNDCRYIEVTDDGRYLHVKDDGRKIENSEVKVPALDACLRYVRQGSWIEVDVSGRPICPTGSYIGEDYW